MLYLQMLRADADVLLRETSDRAQQERLVTAQLLVRLAAVEARRLYAPAGYASMWEYCLTELQMSDDAAGRRLWAARKCREFPALFDALADGRIQLTAVHTLATYLRADNVDELVAVATGRSKAQLKEWLACRFLRPAVPCTLTSVGPAALPASDDSVATPGALVASLSPAPTPDNATDSHALARVPVPSTSQNPTTSQVPLRERARVDLLNAEQVKIEFTISRQVLARMQHAMDLLGAAVAPGDVAALFERLLDLALPALEKRKFAATDHRRAPRPKPTARSRSIPAHVKREVWRRDGGRCTFVNGTGRRCECHRGLHFDHVRPMALGGEATIENIRLLCATHDQLEAERRLGAGFMREKRQEAQREAVHKQVRLAARANAHAAAEAYGPVASMPHAETAEAARSEVTGSGIVATTTSTQDVVPWLRQLGFTVAEARRGAALCAHLPDGSLETRVRVALKGLAPASVRRTPPMAIDPS